MIRAAFQLAWRYVTRHAVQTLLLAAALGLVLALPLTLQRLVRATETNLRARAGTTPQVLGPRGSALDLLLTTLYFKRPLAMPTMPVSLQEEIHQSDLATAIPLHLRFHAQEAPIVGTSLAYFDWRRLALAEGGYMRRLGDCVIGARLAQQRQLAAGSAIFSSPEQVFDMAGAYPLKMRVTGVLAPSGTADDDAVFVDLKTAWLLEGRLHGHDDPAEVLAAKPEDRHIVANAGLRVFQEVTDDNLNEFHFHGDRSAYPISALILLPRDAKAEALLAGRYLKSDTPWQLIRPSEEFDSLLRTLFQIKRLALALFAFIALAALMVAALVFALSFKLRQREFLALEDLGISRRALHLSRSLEILLTGALAVLLAAAMVGLVHFRADSWVTRLLG